MNSIFRIIASGVLFLSISAGSFAAQDEKLPPMEGFSYQGEPVFGASEEMVIPGTGNRNKEGVEALGDAQALELRLALDRALSRILKLTVDYQALLSKVNRMRMLDGSPAIGATASVSAPGAEGGGLDELMAVNARQLAERDKIIATLEERLANAQKQYDDANVARLVNQVQLREALTETKLIRQDAEKTDKQLKLLAERLKASQLQVQQLQAELAAAPAAQPATQPGSDQEHSGEAGVVVQAVGDQAASGASTGQFSNSQEWVIKGLTFKPGSAEIETVATGAFTKLVAYLKENPMLSVQVNGYTDNVGSAKSNQHLSQKRADAVAKMLASKGVRQNRITALGYGEKRPVADNKTEQGRARNRRVAVLFFK